MSSPQKFKRKTKDSDPASSKRQDSSSLHLRNQHFSQQQLRSPSQASSATNMSPRHHHHYHRSSANKTTDDSLAETTIQCRSEYSNIRNTALSAFSWTAPPSSSALGRMSRMPIYLECNHHPSGRMEPMWTGLVAEVSVDQEGDMTSVSANFLSLFMDFILAWTFAFLTIVEGKFFQYLL